MSDTQSITVTPQNEAEILAAVEALKGTEQKPDNTETTPPADDQSKPPADDQKAPLENLEIKPQTDEEKAAAAVSEIDMESVAQEYTTNGGKLTDETRTKIVDALTKAGIKNAAGVLDSYIAGQEAAAARTMNETFETVGGEQNFRSMIDWAAKNLSPKEIDRYNKAVKDPDTASLAVRGLYAQFQAAAGKSSAAARRAVTSVPNAGAGLQLVRSDQQVAELVGDPRYNSDPGYRAEVNARIKASMDAGVLK